MVVRHPDFHQEQCLNRQHVGARETTCTRCCDICPTKAIELNDEYIPQLNEKRCTGCTACVHMCPSDAISHEEIDSISIVQQAHELVRQGKIRLRAACNAVSGAPADLSVPCHAAWDPILLACMAAEGIETLALIGIYQCASCPARHGAEIMAKTEKDYAVLNRSLGVHLKVSREESSIPVEQKQIAVPEPGRRTFFRNFVPAMAQSALHAASLINQTVREGVNEPDLTTSAQLPYRLRLFLRALPHLQANFTPVPDMPSIPIGAIQANANCTACNECVEQCPTGALELKDFGTNRILEFSSDACIGCRQCVGRCPEHAIEALPTISLPSLLTRHARPLVMVRPIKV